MADEKELLVRIKGLDELTPVMAKALVAMEASANKLSESIDRIQAPLNNASQATDGLNTKSVNLAATVSLVSTAYNVLVAVYSKYAEQVAHAIDEALEAEQAANQLTGALVSQGMYTEKTTEAIEKYVKAVEATTGTSGEAIQQMIAMGVQMGLSAEKAMQMEEASRKLAAATGVDVMTAFAQMQGALNGQTKALAKVLPGVKDLTEAQLKQGGAIALVSEGLDAQYKLYQGSFAASLAKAKNELSNVYEAVGKIIIQNPLVIKGVQQFADFMVRLAGAVEEADGWIRDNEETILKFGKALLTAAGAVTTTVIAIKSLAFGSAVFEALATSIKLYGVAGTLAANGINFTTIATTGLKAAITFLTGPIGLTIAAVGLLTAAFYKWPGLFDQISGTFKTLVGSMIQGIGWIADKSAALVGIFDKELAKSLKGVAESVNNYGNEWKVVGDKQIVAGTTANMLADIGVVATNRQTKALDEHLKKQNELNAARLASLKYYDGLAYGTEKQREALRGESQARDKDLKEFTEYLENRKRLAIDKETEQANQVASIRAAAMAGGKGTESVKASTDVEVRAEETKQAQLGVLHERGVLNEEQYQEALLASRQRAELAQLENARAHQQALADIMGDSEQGFETKLAMQEERWNLEQQQKAEMASAEGASQQQVAAMQEQQQLEHLAAMNTQKEQYYTKQAQLNEAAGNNFQAYLNRVKAAQVQHGTVVGAMLVTTQTQQFKAVQTGLDNMASLMETKSETLFNIGKAAAMASAVVNTAVAVVNALAVPPFPLGLALAATAGIAGAVQIAKISGQRFNKGGQADEGMDNIPGSLAGKSFVLSQGERVVQPEANKDLTAYLAAQRGENGKGRGDINITLHYNGTGSEGDAKKMASMVVDELRSMSERGTPILSTRGVY